MYLVLELKPDTGLSPSDPGVFFTGLIRASHRRDGPTKRACPIIANYCFKAGDTGSSLLSRRITVRPDTRLLMGCVHCASRVCQLSTCSDLCIPFSITNRQLSLFPPLPLLVPTSHSSHPSPRQRSARS